MDDKTLVGDFFIGNPAFDWYDNTGFLNIQSQRTKKLQFGYDANSSVADGVNGKVWVDFYLDDRLIYTTEKKDFTNKPPLVHRAISFEMPEDITASVIGKTLKYIARGSAIGGGESHGTLYELYLINDQLPDFTSPCIDKSEALGVDGVINLSAINGDIVNAHQNVPKRPGTVTWQLVDLHGSLISEKAVAFSGMEEKTLELKLDKKWFEYYRNQEVKCVSYWTFGEGHKAYWSKPQKIKVLSKGS